MMIKVRQRLLDNINLGHVNFKQFFQPDVNEDSKKSLKPSDNDGNWDISVGFTECGTRLLVLKRNVSIFVINESDFIGIVGNFQIHSSSDLSGWVLTRMVSRDSRI
jgi:hypothetical protein